MARLYAPENGGTKYQVMFRAPAGEGEPWKRVLRRTSSEAEARKIFAQAEAALDTDKELPVSADVRAARTIRAGRQPRVSLAARQKDKNLGWWNYPCAPKTSWCPRTYAER